MPIEITIPRLGWSMEEATFAHWLKSDGDTVSTGDALYTLESDKATQDVDAIDGGVLRISKDGPRDGDIVRVGQLIGFLQSQGEPWPPEPKLDPTKGIASKDTPLATNNIPNLPKTSLNTNDPSTSPEPKSGPRISPRAQRIATELGVDARLATPSGSTGRIREQDVRALAAATQATPPQPRNSFRQRIADRMVASLRQSAPVTLHTTADATALTAWRNRAKSQTRSDDDSPPTLTDLLVHCTACALAQHPALNARWEGQVLTPSPQIHIGIAVDTDAGLLVPVIREANTLGFRELKRCTRDLVERARTRKLAPDEMQGGTFTVTNLGTFGIDAFTPIINPPECAILGVGRIQKRPMVVGEQIAIRDILSLSLTFDHRALDGAPAARFLQTLTKLIEVPSF